MQFDGNHIWFGSFRLPGVYSASEVEKIFSLIREHRLDTSINLNSGFPRDLIEIEKIVDDVLTAEFKRIIHCPRCGGEQFREVLIPNFCYQVCCVCGRVKLG